MGLRGCSVVAAAAVVALAGWAWGAAGDVPAAREGAARVARDVPFSFRYGGKDGRELLKGWRRTETDGGGKRVATYEDPATRLRVVCEVRTFADFPGVAEWVVRFVNGGATDSPLLEDVRALDWEVGCGVGGDVAVDYGKGSLVGPANDDFVPLRKVLGKGGRLGLPGEGKVPSQAFLPYFNVEWPGGGGVLGAIGWTGQWALEVARDAATGAVQIRCGQQVLRAHLRPGESVRTPRMLLAFWDGADRLAGNNLLRRVLVAHYLPRQDGEVEMPPVMGMHDADNWLNVPRAEQQIADIGRMREMGADLYWLDASWFDGAFPQSVGNWHVRSDIFPGGLAPIGRRCHELGMRFLWWVEPERAGRADDELPRLHPEWYLTKTDPGWVDPESGWAGNPGEILFNLGDDKAREWMTDLLSARITEMGIDVLREDRNTRPVRYWRAADVPGREGITENHHVEGLYRMWDDLRQRHPGLVIDSCNWRNTGPDIEVLSRSAGAWTRSEIGDCGRLAVPNQVAVQGLCLYAPVHANGLFALDPYHVRSVSVNGTSIPFQLVPGVRDDPSGKTAEVVRQIEAEIRRVRPMTLGDFYPLGEMGTDEARWAGWQFDRPEKGDGFAVFLRRPHAGAVWDGGKVRVDPRGKYEVDFYYGYELGKRRVMAGEELAGLKVRLEKPESSVLVEYKRVR